MHKEKPHKHHWVIIESKTTPTALMACRGCKATQMIQTTKPAQPQHKASK
jgi:hypothetical protein